MEYYVDKTGILKEIFPVINTENRFICITRARRFGKLRLLIWWPLFFSKAVMREMFDGMKISSDPDFEKHRNQHNVIFIDFSKMPFLYEEYYGYIISIAKK